MSNKKILHIITGLRNGGAEKNLYNLVKKEKFIHECYVFSLSKESFYETLLKKKKIKVYNFNLKNLLLLPFNLIKLIKLINYIKPDIIQFWMYDSIFISILLKFFLIKKTIIWNLRQSNLNFFKSKKKTLLIKFILIPFSYLIPNKIICCSRKVFSHHAEFFFCKTKLLEIPNGIELEKYFYNKKYDSKLSKKLNLNKNVKVIGFINRYDNQKNFKLFLEFINLLIYQNKNFNIRVLMFGENVDMKNSKLLSEISKYNLDKYVRVLGARKNIHYYYSILDYSVSTSSYGEGFSNTLIETMASNTIPLYSNQGDNKYVLKNIIDVISKQKPEEYVNLFNRINDLDKQKIKKILKLLKVKSYQYSVNNMRNKYLELYENY